MMSPSSLFDSTLLVDACSAFSTLPRSGRMAWNSRLAALLGRAAGGVALDDEQLAVARVGGAAVGELAGQVQAVRHRALALHLSAAAREAVRARAARMTRFGDRPSPACGCVSR